MVDSIVFDQKRVLPCAALCQGEFGIDDLFVGVPCRLGAEGLEEIVEIDLEDQEREQLANSAGAVQELVGGGVHKDGKNTAFEYDPALDTWRILAPLKAGRGSVGVVARRRIRSIPTGSGLLMALRRCCAGIR